MKTKLTSILMLVTLFLISLQNPIYAAVNKTWIDTQVQTFIKNKPVKGMIYALWINEKLVSINAIGESMTSVPATTDMHFRIGGVTETMLTTLLMRLVEEHKLSLSDTIEKWYPKLPNANKVTLKMLANGTSGYPDYVYNQKFIDLAVSQPFTQWTDQSLLKYVVMKPPEFSPGKSQHYTHTDYVILASILSKATHTPMNDLFTSYIFKPLKMNNAKFNLTAVMPSPVLHSFSQDRNIYEDATFWNPSWTAGSGAIVSTIDDLGKWANAWMLGSLLSEQDTQTLRAPDTVGKGKNTTGLYFAMGFGVANHWLIQNPRFGGYSGIFAVLPEKKIIFIAFNSLQPIDENHYPSTGNLSMDLWRQLAADLAPDYPLPQFNQ